VARAALGHWRGWLAVGVLVIGALCMAGCTRTAVGAYGTGVGWCAPATMAGGVHGFPAALMSSAGRAGPVREIAGLPEDCRLVMVTGPGGKRKTGLTGECRAAGGGPVRGRGVAGGSAGPCAGGLRRVPGGKAAAGHGGMPGWPRGAGGPGRPGVTCGGVAA